MARKIIPRSLAAVLVLFPLTAAGADFDPDTGRMELNGDIALNFDSVMTFPAELEFTVRGTDWEPMSLGMVAAMFQADPDGLEGAAAMEFGGTAVRATMDISPWATQLSGRRVEITVWQKPCGSEGYFEVSWYTEGESNPYYLGNLVFQPTGRATDDGWFEMSSGPFDWDFGGVHPPVELSIGDLQLTSVWRGQWVEYDSSLCTLIDALEVFDLGPAAVPAVTCDAPTGETTCGPHGLCALGRCIDGASIFGLLPADERVRSDYVNRRAFELRAFEGGRIPQERMDDFEDTMAVLAEQEGSPRFGLEYGAAVADLRDGHASAASRTWTATLGMGICAHLGVADLLPNGGLYPLVFSKLNDNPVSRDIEIGDALVAIDGQDPYDWATDRKLIYAGDPRARTVVMAPDLIDAAAMAGSTITFSRCTNPPVTPDPCDPADVLTYDLDLAALVGDAIWTDVVPSWVYSFDWCDYRFDRGVDDPDVKHPNFAGYQDDANGIRTLLINAVPGRQSWLDTVRSALDPAPGLLILDQRKGSGGQIYSVDLLAGLLIDPADFDRMLMVPWIERPFDDGVRDLLDNCEDGFGLAGGCGYTFRWVLGEEALLGADHGLAAATPLAVLNADDVSGNDYTSRLLSYRSGPTRFFGAGSTRGAFGVVWSLPRHLHEQHGGSFQVHDTVFSVDGTTFGEFATGLGVVPDEVVYQSQRDILAGVDSVIEAAQTWLLTGGW